MVKFIIWNAVLIFATGFFVRVLAGEVNNFSHGPLQCYDIERATWLGFGQVGIVPIDGNPNSKQLYYVTNNLYFDGQGLKTTSKAESLSKDGWIFLSYCGGTNSPTKEYWSKTVDRSWYFPGIFSKVISKGFVANLTKDKLKPKHCVGNPIDLESGEKVQHEQNVISAGEISFSFVYQGDAQNKWKSSFDSKIEPFITLETERAFYKSDVHPTRELACTSGWQNIKKKINEAWVNEVTAILKGPICHLVNAQGQTINFLAIEDTFLILSTPTTASSPIIKGGGGEAISFSAVAPGMYLPNNLTAQKTMKINARGEWELTLIDGSIEVYSSDGALIRKIKNNYIQEFVYDPAGTKLLKIQDNKGSSLEYFYAGAYLQKVVTNDGRSIEIAYNGLGMLQTITQNGAKKSFHYEDTRFPMNLTGIIDERGVRFATWKYDEKGRAISSEHAGGAEKVSLTFNSDGSTTVTNALGKKTTYSFTDILGVRRVSKVTGEPTASCVGANQTYTYTPQGQVETKTDWSGSVTKYTYDSFGRELTKTQAYGTPDAKTTQTCWHPTLNQPGRIIEPTKITLFEYTASGQLKSQIVKPRPAGAVDCSTAL